MDIDPIDYTKSSMNLCRLLRKSMWLNITLYVILGLVLLVSGALFINHMYTDYPDEKKKKNQERIIKTVFLVGMMVFILFFVFNHIVTEWGKVDKCKEASEFIHDQFSYLKRSLDITNLTNTIVDKIKDAILSRAREKIGFNII